MNKSARNSAVGNMHKYAELTSPQGVARHSFAQLVYDNPTYQSIDTPTNNVYSPTVFSNGTS